MFDTEQKCYDYLSNIRWGGKVKCPYCECEKIYITNTKSRYGYDKEIKKYYPPTQYKCSNKKCLKKFSITSETIFHSSKSPIHNFFYMIFSSCMNKKNVSSYQNSLNLGMAQKNTWYIMQRIRMLCFQDDSLKLDDEVEVDETYLAASKWRRRGKGTYVEGRKIPVLGLIQRGGGKIIIKVIPNKNKKTVQDIILKHVECGSRLISDGAACYFNMENYYIHDSINHREGIYVIGDIHTNNIENAWSAFKKAVVGTHHCVSIEHLQRYCDEFAYRWNTKHMTPMEKFNDLIKRGCLAKPATEKSVAKGVSKKKKKILAQ